jgi:hypothetical protein
MQQALDELAAVIRAVEPAPIATDAPVDVVAPLVALASAGREGAR